MLHPLLDYHEEIGYSMGLILPEGKTIQILNKKVETLEIGNPSTDLLNSKQVIVKKLKFMHITQKTREEILKISKELMKNEKIKNKAKDKLFNFILERVEWYWYHTDTRWYIFITTFILATYFHRLFTVFPHLILQGLRQTGKTTAAMLMQKTAWNPTELQSGLRPAPTFREIENSRPTFIADATKIATKNPELADLFEVIEQNGAVRRCIGDNNVPTDFKVYCPKVFCVRRNVPFAHKSIECVTTKPPKTIEMDYTKRRVSMESDTKIHKIVGFALRSLICNWKSVSDDYLSLEQNSKLYGRRFELWRPFLAVCKTYSPDHYEELLTLAYEDAERMERGDLTSDVEDAVVGFLLGYGEDQKYVTVALKKITSNLQETLGTSVVRSYHIIKSAIKNLGVAKRNYKMNEGVKYEINLVKTREIAKERGITREHHYDRHRCQICYLPIERKEEIGITELDGIMAHVKCIEDERSITRWKLHTGEVVEREPPGSPGAIDSYVEKLPKEKDEQSEEGSTKRGYNSIIEFGKAVRDFLKENMKPKNPTPAE